MSVQPQSKEKGTVLLTTLLIMSVMAALAVAIMDDIRFAVKRTINVGDYAQVDWYVKGGEDFTRSYIQDTLQGLSDAQKNTALAAPQDFAFPFEGGAMSINVRDGGHCFSLGGLLSAEGAANAAGVRQFRQLLIAIGTGEGDAGRISDVVVDWVDSDSQRLANGAEDGTYLGASPAHRTANGPLSSVMELRNLSGVDEDLYQSLRPFLCARAGGSQTQFNIETAQPNHAALLAALLGGAEFIDIAARLITERPSSGYENMEALLTAASNAGFDGSEFAQDQISFAPEYLWVELQVQYKNAGRQAAYEFELLDNAGPNLTYRGWGTESFRPQILEEETQ